jgi:hypothetical protein
MAVYATAGRQLRAFLAIASRAAARFTIGGLRLTHLTLLISLVLGNRIPASAEAPQPPAPVFEKAVLPILTAHCLKCHGLEARKAGLDLRTAGLIEKGGESGPALMPGAPNDSPLYARVADRSMPPKGELPLSDNNIEVMRNWIASGAKSTGGE